MKSHEKAHVISHAAFPIWSAVMTAATKSMDFVTRACIKGHFASEDMKGKAMRTANRFGTQIRFLMCGLFLISAGACPAYAVPSASDVFGSILGIVCAMFQYVGIGLTVWGIAQFVLAVKRTDGESKSDAMQTIVCGIVLIGIKPIVTALNLGFTVKDVSI